jgi:hypothetical protein
MFNENLKVTGDVVVTVTGKDGEVKDQREIKNLVVSTGRQFIAQSMLKTTSNTPAAMSHMAVGSGLAAASAGDAALGAQLGRVAFTDAVVTNNVVSYTANFPAGVGTGAITEAGVFNASSGGTMLCRTVFPVVNKGADDAMSITWQVTVS